MRLLIRIFVLVAFATTLPPQSLRAQSEERTVYASVVDKSDAPAAGLTASDFIVREDNVTREVLRISRATEPLQIAVLIDTSDAIESYVLDLRNALRAFFKQMGGKHEISLIGFGERPTVLVDYTHDPARLEKGLGLVFARPGSGTYLLDAIVEAGNALGRRKAARPHLVVVTAQGPEFSERHHDNVLEQLRESGATLHSFVLTKPGAGQTDRAGQELNMSLADGTKNTGGRRDDLLTGMALPDRLQALSNELNNQYAITYARPRTLIPPKSIEVSTRRPGITVRARRWS